MTSECQRPVWTEQFPECRFVFLQKFISLIGQLSKIEMSKKIHLGYKISFSKHFHQLEETLSWTAKRANRLFHNYGVRKPSNMFSTVLLPEFTAYWWNDGTSHSSLIDTVVSPNFFYLSFFLLSFQFRTYSFCFSVSVIILVSVDRDFTNKARAIS